MLVVRRLVLLVLLVIPAFSATSHPLSSNLQDIAGQAEQAQASDHLPDAINLYQKGLHLDPRWKEGWWSLGSILYDQDRFPEAQAAFEHFVALSPNPGPGNAFLALCEYETHEYDRALHHFRSWASTGWTGTPQLIDVGVFHFALLLTREGSFVPALYLLSAEVQKNYSGPALIEAMGIASLRMQNIPEDYPAERHEAVWLAGRAAFHAAAHPADFARANEYGSRLSTHYGQTPNVHYFLGTLHNFQSDYAGAEIEFKHELQISPKHAAAMLALARLAMDDDRQKESEALAKSASELDPKNPATHSLYGEILLKAGNADNSARELEIAKKLAPDSASIRFQLAAAYRRLHRAADADRETAAFNLLKDKQLVMASAEEKLKSRPELLK